MQLLGALMLSMPIIPCDFVVHVHIQNYTKWVVRKVFATLPATNRSVTNDFPFTDIPNTSGDGFATCTI